MLMRMANERVRTDWPLLFHHFLHLVETPAKTNFDDLRTQLLLLGIWPESLSDSKIPAGGLLRDWNVRPPLICLSLVIPRSVLHLLKNLNEDNSPASAFFCEIQQTTTKHNFIFSSLTAAFGSLATTGMNGSLDIVPEATSYESGTAPLIVSFWIRASLLADCDSATTKIAFGRRSRTIQLVADGLDIVYLNDPSVHISHARPQLPDEIKSIQALSYRRPNPAQSQSSPIVVKMDSTGARILSLSHKLDMHSPEAQSLLTSGASVSGDQLSPCTMKVSLASLELIVVFPFPIDSTALRLRISRKSHYIEIIVPISLPLTANGFYLDPSPIIVEDQIPVLWNLPRINLDRLPHLKPLQNFSDGADSLLLSAGRMCSDREGTSELDEINHSPTETVFSSFKKLIRSLVMRFISSQGEPPNTVVKLFDKDTNNPFAYLFIDDLRLDLPSRGFVLDAYFLPVANVTSRLALSLARVMAGIPYITYPTTASEIPVWKRMIPALGAFRCPSRSEAIRSAAAGKGKDVDAYRGKRLWATLLWPYMTRIALSAMFPISYIERVSTEEDFVHNVIGPHMPKKMYKKVVTTMESVCAARGWHGSVIAPFQLRRCSRCKVTTYCSVECQRKDWNNHKASCIKSSA
ncbi:hypothetical protein BV25DRAFT_1988057 [Artomyces pyxidatus]|uniref:Uncharacterized protein n=1 Tax=Artomyces pyxidatus TaxID=48021 RepID=A0ACB8TEY0_9AGAM|nr:hypothetical protein BV25DRAFT_1988057 [Artomyces pyxidatus]